MHGLVRKFLVIVAAATLCSCASNRPDRTHLSGRTKAQSVEVDALRADGNKRLDIRPTDSESGLIEVSYRHLKEQQIKILDCVYDGSTDHYYFWYGNRTYSRADFLRISPAHPLARLSETPLIACPPSLEQAQTLERENLIAYQLAANERLNYLQASPGGNGGRLNENQCIEVGIENIALTHYMRNRCDFAVRVVFAFNPPGHDLGVSRVSAVEIHIASNGAQVLSIIRQDQRSSVSFWACHYSRVPVSRSTRPIASSNGQPRDIWRCERERAE